MIFIKTMQKIGFLLSFVSVCAHAACDEDQDIEQMETTLSGWGAYSNQAAVDEVLPLDRSDNNITLDLKKQRVDDVELLVSAIMRMDINDLHKNRSLILRESYIGDKAANTLLELIGFIRNSSNYLEVIGILHILDLSFNEISCKGVIHLANSLNTNNTMTNLNLSNNKIENDGARALAVMIEKNRMLRYIDLVYNNITDPGISAIMSALESRFTSEISSVCSMISLPCVVLTLQKESPMMPFTCQIRIHIPEHLRERVCYTDHKES